MRVVWSLQGPGSLAASAPPARVSFLCGVSCCLPLSCARFASPKSVASWLPPHHPPHQRPPSESRGGVLEAAPRCWPLRSQSPVLALLVTLRKDPHRPAGDQGHSGALGPGSVRPAALVLPRGTGSLPRSPPPEEALGSVFTLPSGALGVPSEAAGGPRAQKPLPMPPFPHVASLRSFQKFSSAPRSTAPAPPPPASHPGVLMRFVVETSSACQDPVQTPGPSRWAVGALFRHPSSRPQHPWWPRQARPLSPGGQAAPDPRPPPPQPEAAPRCCTLGSASCL